MRAVSGKYNWGNPWTPGKKKVVHAPVTRRSVAVFDREDRHCTYSTPALPFFGTVSKGSKVTRASSTNKYESTVMLCTRS